MTDDMRPIGVFYEHQEWFEPLFRELERQGVPHERVDARSHRFDPAGEAPGFSLVLNRMSPSAHLRGRDRVIAHTLAYLEHLERRGVRVVNGVEAFRTEISKTRQLLLMDQLGLAHPASRVVNHPDEAVEAADDLRFPVVVKANRGGSGAGIRRFDAPDQLRAAADAGELEPGPDGTALVQEFVPARGGHITRVEVLGGEFLYAIHVHLSGETFNLCPADICRTSDGEELRREDDDVPDAGLEVEACRPPDEVIREVERLAAAAGVEVGGVEYLVDDRDGTVRYYDVNALSNFVADPERVLGFDPFERMVAWLEEEARAAEQSGAAAGGVGPPRREGAAGRARPRDAAGSGVAATDGPDGPGAGTTAAAGGPDRDGPDGAPPDSEQKEAIR